jgi:hypothetical protein
MQPTSALKKLRLTNFILFLQLFATNPPTTPYNSNISDVKVPTNSRQSAKSPQYDLWTSSENSDIHALSDAGCLVESDLPPGFTAIDPKFVYPAKSDYEGWVQNSNIGSRAEATR